MSPTLRLYGLLLGLAVLLAACQLFPLGPGVSSVTPAANAAAVAINTSVVATLTLSDGPINPTTLTDLSVTLTETGGAAVVSTRALSEDGNTLTLTPTTTLKPNTNYTFKVTTDVLTTANTPLTAWQSTFTTGTGLAGKPSDSDLAPSRSPLTFTAGGETTTDTRTLTLTNTSSQTIDVFEPRPLRRRCGPIHARRS